MQLFAGNNITGQQGQGVHPACMPFAVLKMGKLE
jgi:hypothetical protein